MLKIRAIRALLVAAAIVTAALPCAAQSPQAAQPQLPPPEQMIYLIRNTTVAVNHANLTGNYSVLHALSAPSLRATTTVEKLADGFAAMRNSHFDFGVTLAVTPQFAEAPSINAQGILRLTGYYPTQPRITFDFGYQVSEGQWRPIAFGIGIMPAPVQAEPEAANKKPAVADKKKKP